MIARGSALVREPAGIRRAPSRVLARYLRRNPTPAERVLWQLVRSRQLGVKFRRQALVLAYIADLYAPSVMLTVELDGAAHTATDTDAYRRRRWDDARDRQLRRHGYEVIRFPNELVLTDPNAVVSTLRAAIVARQQALETRQPTGVAKSGDKALEGTTETACSAASGTQQGKEGHTVAQFTNINRMELVCAVGERAERLDIAAYSSGSVCYAVLTEQERARRKLAERQQAMEQIR